MIEMLIIKIALQQNIDPNLLLGVCYKESHFQNVNVEADGTSETAHSVCQVHDVAARQVGMSYLDLNIPANNILVAALYLKYQMERCGETRAGIAAYNTGKCIAHPIKGGYVDQVQAFSKEFEFRRMSSLAYN